MSTSTIRRPARRRRAHQFLPAVVPLLVLFLLPGCGALGIPDLAPTRKQSLLRMDPVRIQADTVGFADRFVTAMTSVCDKLEASAAMPAAKDYAHQLKTDLALGAISDAVNPRPVAGLMDLVVLVRLLRQIAEGPNTATLFGPDAADLVDSLHRQEADLHAVARQYLTDPQLAELDQLADRWHTAHPTERSASHTHLADLPEANLTPTPAGKAPTSVFGLLFFDPTADLDPAVREIELSRATSERMFFYLQRLPLLLQLQGETFYRQFLEIPEFKQALNSVATVSDSTVRFADIGSRFTDAVAAFPVQLAQERQAAIQQLATELASQRDLSLRQLGDTVSTQRDLTIHQFADAVAAQRNAAITQITEGFAAQRDLALQQFTFSVQQQQQLFLTNLEEATNRSLDRFVNRLALLALTLLLLIFIGALIRRRSQRPAIPSHHTLPAPPP
jgi:hypothetical protein